MSAEQTVPTKIAELTGIRGLAACWVFVFHIWLVAGSPVLVTSGIDFTPLFACGWVGVDLFFVLSGFVLTWSYAGTSSKSFHFVDFMRRRTLRVIPAYYIQFIALLALSMIGVVASVPTVSNAVAHLLMVHNLSFQWNAPLPNTWWTLPIEWQFYLIFPILLGTVVRGTWLRTLVAIVVVVLAWRIGAWWWLQTFFPTASVDYKVWLIEQLPGRLDQFFIGMLAASLTRRSMMSAADRDMERLSNALVGGGFILVTVLTFILWPRAKDYWEGHWLLYTWHLMVALPLAMLIAGVSLRGRLARTLLGNKPLLWLGEISYSVYLWNYVVLLALVKIGAFDSLAGSTRIVGVAAYGTLAVLVVATLSWWFTERPFLHYRDSASDSPIERHLAAFIRAPWTGIGLVGLLVIGVLLTSQFLGWPARSPMAQCSERGHVDTSFGANGGDDITHVDGWTVDASQSDRIRRIVVLLDGRIVGEGMPTIERKDVATALPLCQVQRPGFSIALDVRNLPLTGAKLIVEAERNSGRRYRIGELDWQFSAPHVSIDKAPSPVLNGENIMQGWAWHPSGPVKVIWRTQDQVLATATAELQRKDVGDQFPTWDGAERSGFSFHVRFDELPRQTANTVFEFLAPNGQRRQVDGPTFQNDHPIGMALRGGGLRYVDPALIPIEAWLYDEQGIESASVETELGVSLGVLHQTKESTPLPDLDKDPRGVPSGAFWGKALREGSLFSSTIPGKAVPAGLQRIVVRVRNKMGRESVLPGPLVSIGRPMLATTCPDKPFTTYLWATTEMLRSGLKDLGDLRKMGESGCFRFGLHTRVEYLRTTKGKQNDFKFDPDFPDSKRKDHGKEMTTTSLTEALAMADHYRVPMRILLDGGVWADSLFSVPEFDITDWLEQDDRNVQWNQFGKAEPDDALRGLPGGHDNPQLGRVVTLNIYNTQYRHYKKRNLQAAVRVIADYNRQHPDRPVSITMDPDLYINPWFYLKEWYDYNPDTLRQFREWLTATGPYAPGQELAGQSCRERLTLSDINRIAKAHWSSIDAVDPPRERLDYTSPWHQLWTAFKRHLVGRHYADLASWAHEAGLPSEHIFSAQTFIQADVSVTGDDKATGWVDEAGVSIAGAKPPDGHLGAILYGPASRNDGLPRSGTSLFANIAKTDPSWDAVEMNPADISAPDRLPDHVQAYRTITNIFNYGAGAMSPMWNGLAGDQSVRPGQFKSYEVFGQSPFETQLILFAREIEQVPRGSQLWTFGNAYVTNDDGFRPLPGTKLVGHAGAIAISSEHSRGCGIVHELESRAIPEHATMLVDGSNVESGELRILFGDGSTTDRTLLRQSGDTVSSALDGLESKPIQQIELRFAECPATIRRIAIVKH